MASAARSVVNTLGDLRSVMIPVYEGEAADDQQLTDIREAFYQNMLAMLGGFYGVKAGIQFTSDAHAAIKRQPNSTVVPRVFGDRVMGLVVLQSAQSGDDHVSASQATAPVGFTISDGAAPIGGVDALAITVVLTAQLPPRVGAPFAASDELAESVRLRSACGDAAKARDQRERGEHRGEHSAAAITASRCRPVMKGARCRGVAGDRAERGDPASRPRVPCC